MTDNEAALEAAVDMYANLNDSATYSGHMKKIRAALSQPTYNPATHILVAREDVPDGLAEAAHWGQTFTMDNAYDGKRRIMDRYGKAPTIIVYDAAVVLADAHLAQKLEE